LKQQLRNREHKTKQRLPKGRNSGSDEEGFKHGKFRQEIVGDLSCIPKQDTNLFHFGNYRLDPPFANGFGLELKAGKQGSTEKGHVTRTGKAETTNKEKSFSHVSEEHDEHTRTRARKSNSTAA
jgi:hypothetical protein